MNRRYARNIAASLQPRALPQAITLPSAGASNNFFVVLVLSEAVLSETVLLLDGCLNCGGFLNLDAAARWSLRFAVTFGPVGRIAILDCFK